MDVLFAHPMPDHIIICQRPPTPGNLGRLAKRGCIEITENFESDFGGKRGHKVDSDQFTDGGGDERQLRKATLGHDPLKHEFSVLGRGRGKERPDMGDSLLIALRKRFQILHKLESSPRSENG